MMFKFKKQNNSKTIAKIKLTRGFIRTLTFVLFCARKSRQDLLIAISKLFNFRNKNDGKTGARQKLVCGFTLLYASMVAGLLLAIGAAILSITVKQISLSAAGRESQLAFYNADSGTECALYLYRSSKTDTCPAGLFPEPGTSSGCDKTNANDYLCLGVSISDFNNNVPGKYSFSVNTQATKNVCFDITVDKTVANRTTIVSKGYNTCGSVNRFERAIEVDF